MANKPAPALPLRDGDQAILEKVVRSSATTAGAAQRARIVLLASQGVANALISELVGVSRPTVNLWRGRYLEHGLEGLVDIPRPGRPKVVDDAAIITATLRPPPKRLGVTHWSSRLLAPRLGVHKSTVTKAWKKYGIRPWKADTFKFSTDPELEAKVTDIVGMYLNPPANAIVLCVDEKSQIQALNRTQKVLPMQPGHNEQRSHDYVRHGTTTLFAALEIATGKVTGLCKDRHRHQEFLGFLTHVARAYPGAGTTPGDGQLRRAQASRGPQLAYSKPTHQGPLHPDVGVMVEPGRGLVRHHRTPSHPTRYLRLSPRVDRQDPRIHQQLEQPETPVHLDQNPRRNPRQNQPQT